MCFSEVSAKHTHGLRQSQLTTDTGSAVLTVSASWLCSSLCSGLLACIAGLLAPASALSYTVTHPAFRMFLADGRGQGGLLVPNVVVGRSWSRPLCTELLCKRNTASETVDNYILIKVTSRCIGNLLTISAIGSFGYFLLVSFFCLHK